MAHGVKSILRALVQLSDLSVGSASDVEALLRMPGVASLLTQTVPIPCSSFKIRYDINAWPPSKFHKCDFL